MFTVLQHWRAVYAHLQGKLCRLKRKRRWALTLCRLGALAYLHTYKQAASWLQLQRSPCLTHKAHNNIGWSAWVTCSTGATAAAALGWGKGPLAAAAAAAAASSCWMAALMPAAVYALPPCIRGGCQSYLQLSNGCRCSSGSSLLLLDGSTHACCWVRTALPVYTWRASKLSTIKQWLQV